MGTELLYALAASMGFNIVMFLIAFWKKTDVLTDISYALSFTFLAGYGIYQADGATTQQWIIAGLVWLWALRIGSYLLMRIRKMGHDKRFDERRNSFVKFGSFWLLQGFTAWVVMLGGLQFMLGNVEASSTFFIIGVLVALDGLLIETFSDLQKFKFISNKKNKGKWIDTGLWKYSRHPNYFGEIVVWLGVHIAVVSGLETSTQQLIASISPLFIAFLLLFVSGVPLLEKSADKKWGKDKKYQEYKAKTSLLIPLPVKK